MNQTDPSAGTPPAKYDDLRPAFVNCTLKRSPQESHTDTLLDVVRSIYGKHGVGVDSIRLVDHAVAEGVYPDMTEHGFERDAWPRLFETIAAADILVVGTPIWLGEAGPGPSYGDEMEGGERAGFDNEFTQRNSTFAAWNMLHLARLLKDAGGIPAHGNQRSSWEAGCRFDYENPDYR